MGLPHVVMSSALWVQIFLRTPQVGGKQIKMTGGQQIEMTMQYDAFDDQYKGCEKEMDSIASQLLKDEMRNNKFLLETWAKARDKWQNEIKKKVSPLPLGFKDEYGIAVIMYTCHQLYRDFNQAVRTNGTSLTYYQKNFQYKAFHFYLTRALQLLPKVKYTIKLFRGLDRFTHRGRGPMRFGHFSSTSQNRSISESYGNRTFYTIYTYLGVDIQKFSFHENEQEVLIPVNEVFTVTPKKGGHFILNSKKALACFNCAYKGNEKDATCSSDGKNATWSSDEKDALCSAEHPA
ncbi:ecto-ADP-ribosyltransferase 5-like isoform X3 [Ornithorhynchus anatinus]|uniref:ecto-ADP-ribosyltransferase 5-like isoform X3 n=1 Tax=Ornithorhynchus anatinus TaxID=9258 RepID=UPI0010A82972|nr:ecto-ADP-ribosyltransferase 5-like isoform X3 [Ornithorhynchus anatinus]